jgi:LmbE family N-acetylglucosaminyl deacetylase
MNTKNILIISAHADDHVACAGTVFKLRKERGFVPYEIVLTDSSLGQDFKARNEIARENVARMRKKELSKASRFLGIQESFQLGQPDLGLVYSPEVMFEIVRVIRKVQPQIVFTHNAYDAHPDHLAAHELSIHALKIAAMGVQKETLGAPYRTPLVLCAEGMLPIQSCLLVDVTKYMHKKQKLFALYESQASSKAMDFEQGLAHVRGYHVRTPLAQYAEAFDIQNQFPSLIFNEEMFL